MAKKMLIDATHPEETRVVVADGNKVEDFDFESAARRQLAGNIYLAKVTRVEPSLQAAFIDYGGNRHGFLAFSEIHPGYYQIPVADREALLAEERELATRDDDEDDDANGEGNGGRNGGRGRKPRRGNRAASAKNDPVTTADPERDTASGADGASEIAGMEMIDLGEGEDDVDGAPEGLSPMLTVGDTPVETPEAGNGGDAGETGADRTGDQETDTSADTDNVETVEKDDTIETVSAEDDSDEVRPQRKPRIRRYKIQEVINVRQILLVQVVKEERGNKGAALTTYLSLAGRYCVLMPNTARGGGISRKITNAVDRKKLKEIAAEIDVPDGAGLIIRTAGSQRTRTEIKRDYEYLQRLWEQIRELTLRSIAPAKIYEEGDLIKRSIRDLYSKEIDEVIVEGEAGFRTARDFMKMIMPSHAKNVKPYTDTLPIFTRHQVEPYLESMFNPTVQLPSGGYIVIGVTEALVAIDVNSGRATKEGSIEQTALKTNLEAADEIARQLRLRDLAGLIVVDFIDMDERKNNAAVEKRFKDKLKADRARIQVGRISGFGLLEMSRQRLRPGMIEATTQPCPHCHGTGLLRSDNNVALTILRQLEEEGGRGRSKEVLIRAPMGIVNFLINAKRDHIADVERRFGLSVRIECDPALISPDYAFEKFKTATRAIPEPVTAAISGNAALMAEVEEEDKDLDLAAEDEDEDEEEQRSADNATDSADSDDRPRKKRRRRRRRRVGPGEAETAGNDTAEDAAATDASDDAVTPQADAAAEDAPPARRTRVRSRKPRADAEAEPTEAPAETPAPQVASSQGTATAGAGAEDTAATVPAGTAEEAAPAKPRRASRSRKADPAPEAPEAQPEEAAVPRPPARRTRKPKVAPTEAEDASPEAEAAPEPGAAATAEIDPAREPAPPADDTTAALTLPEPTSAEESSTATADTPVEKAPATPTTEADDRPRRRGWWSLNR
ncbi:MAG: Rne/Rng family ribonuclease [Rubellimicrobium sp.]|nr:Rne/Rng family ribonuclease [Rubellimicrobium sp.]